jgi:hypothetical protein
MYMRILNCFEVLWTPQAGLFSGDRERAAPEAMWTIMVSLRNSEHCASFFFQWPGLDATNQGGEEGQGGELAGVQGADGTLP